MNFLNCLCIILIAAAACPLAQMAGLDIQTTTTYNVPNCDASVYQIPYLTESDGSYVPAINSQISLCYTSDGYFVLNFINHDYYIRNTYQKCNDNLYNQDVVELFLGDPNSEPAPIHHYVELEFSPTSVMFAAKIYNPNLNNTDIQHEYL